MNSKQLYESFSYIDDKYLDMVDAPEKETNEMSTEKKHISFRRAITFLLAAAIAVSVMTITAAAAGWIPGIFSALKEAYPEDEALFEAAEAANSEPEPEIKEIPQLDYSKFALFEKYYDGETILLGYDLDVILPDPFICYELDPELLEAKSDFGSIGWEEEQAWHTAPKTENTIKYNLTGDAASMDCMFQEYLSPEDYEEAWCLLLEEGHVCMGTYDVWVGDHILVNGADMIETLGPENSTLRAEYETEVGDCIKLNPLPEAGINQDRATVTLNIRSCLMYWYMDLEGNAYYFSGNHETETMEFTLENVIN